MTISVPPETIWTTGVGTKQQGDRRTYPFIYLRRGSASCVNRGHSHSGLSDYLSSFSEEVLQLAQYHE
jgi:hypothetical protein